MTEDKNEPSEQQTALAKAAAKAEREAFVLRRKTEIAEAIARRERDASELAARRSEAAAVRERKALDKAEAQAERRRLAQNRTKEAALFYERKEARILDIAEKLRSKEMRAAEVAELKAEKDRRERERKAHKESVKQARLEALARIEERLALQRESHLIRQNDMAERRLSKLELIDRLKGMTDSPSQEHEEQIHLILKEWTDLRWVGADSDTLRDMRDDQISLLRLAISELEEVRSQPRRPFLYGLYRKARRWLILRLFIKT